MNCTGLFGKLLGHNYRPNYNTIPPESISADSGSLYALKAIAESLTKRIYVNSVCKRCGQSTKELK